MCITRAVYSPGDTVWFKAYLMKANTASDISKSFYIDWFDDDGKLLSHDVYPIANASSQGSFVVPLTYGNQQLHVVAYTKWMLNFESSFLYRKDVEILQRNNSQETLSSSNILLHFFPEGGKLIEGVKNKVAFLIADSADNPYNVAGYISDKEGHFIDSFKTQHEGMGYFMLTPQKGESYIAIWNGKKTELPITKESVSITGSPQQKKLKFVVQKSASTTESNLQLKATMYQQIVFQSLVMFDKDSFAGEINTQQFPSGILQLTLLDKAGLPLAERIVFVNNHEMVAPVNISTDTLSTDKRAKNEWTIHLSDTAVSNLSLSVTNSTYGYDSTENIISRLLLSSEIKGRINNPTYYFSDDKNVEENLDLVMLTHGWCRYDWEDISLNRLPPLKYNADTTYMFFGGKVKLPHKQSDTSAFGNIIVFTRNINDTITTSVVMNINKDGSFGNSMLMFDSSDVSYQFSNKKLSKISLDVKFFDGRLDTALLQNQVISKTNKDFKQPAKPFLNKTAIIRNIQYDNIAGKGLADVVVNAQTKTNLQILEDRYVNQYRGMFGYSVDVRNIKSIHDITGIYEYLMGKFPGLAVDMKNPFKPIIGYPKGLKVVPLKLFLDEMPVSENEIIFRPFYKYALVKYIPKVGVIFYSAKGLDEFVSVPSKLDEQRIIGYSLERYFYNPDYSRQNNLDKTDYRKTIYWNPLLLTSQGQQNIKIIFYNDDFCKSFRIDIEGINNNGEFIHVDKNIQ